MATPDTKPGFRLPWSADRGPSVSETEMPDDALDPSAAALAETGDATTPPEEIETPAMIDAAPATTSNEAAVDAPGAELDLPVPPMPAPTLAALPPVPARKPNKFMADLTRAMQAAAESARTDALERVAAEAKLKVEAIHADSAGEATELRKRADDDVATVREWSKAEIARIREETDERIAHRKQRLEHEIEEHAAAIEARIERVQRRVSAYEAEMESFFERLRAEQDPTHFAAMAESLPDAPPFDVDVDDDDDYATPSLAASASPSAVEIEPEATVEVATPEPIASDDGIVAVTELVTAPEAQDDEGADLFSIGSDALAESDDPRLSALGLSADFAAAEAEAAAFSPDDEGSDEPMPDIPDEAIAARLAGLGLDNDTQSSDTVTTRLVVTGLISVASIAGFKRHLTSAGGVQSVGVSSGPGGEFVFNVGHDTSVAMKDIVPSLPGFAARVTSEGDGELAVSAHDPETGD
ncbi:MAG: hypothetical protein ACSLFN_05825 [Candidatus Limnocylindrales bacterium]